MRTTGSITSCKPFITLQMICWMIFSCKYAERNLEMLGNKEEEKMSGLQELLEGLQTLETVLGGT